MASRSGRVALVVVIALVVLAAASAVLVRRVLDGGSIRAAAETRLTAMLGQPVHIGRLSIAVLPRLAVTGANVTVGPAAGTAPAVAVDRITIVPTLRSLIRGPAVIEDVRLEGMTVSVLRDRSGAWHLPSAVPAPTPVGQAGISVERVRVNGGRLQVFDEQAAGGMRQTSSIDRVEAEIVSTDTGLRLAPVSGRIGSAAISGEATTDADGAHLDFSSEAITDTDLPALLGLVGASRPDGLRLHAPAAASMALSIDRRSSRLSGKGTLRAPDLELVPLRLQRFNAPFTLDGARLVLDPTEFSIYGGTHRGSVVVDTAGEPRWSLDSRVTQLDLGAFLNALSASGARVDGTAVVAGNLQGRLDTALADSVAGTAHLAIRDGVIREFPLLAAINRAAQLTEGDARDTKFQRLSATLALGSGRATTSDLVLEAGQVRVEAAGTMGFDRSLALKGKAILSAEKAAGVMRSVRELSGLRNSRGELEIPLTISGTLDAPDFGLDLKSLIGKGVEDELKRRLRGLFGR